MHRYIWTAVILLSLLLSIPRAARAGLEETTYTGTGFVIHPDGYLLTCAHLIDYGDADAITVTLDGRTYPASVLDFDYMRDIALLQIQAQNLPSLPLANSNVVRLGEEVRAVGFPLQGLAGGGIKMTRGSIAGITTIGTQKTFQIDAPINSGNSGGPIVNERGEVVGIVNAKLTMEGVEGVGFAVPVNYARALLRNEFIEPLTLEQGEKLDGPTLAERVTPAVAFITVETTEWVGGDGDENDELPYVADVLRTRVLEIIADNGKVCGVFAMSNDGTPMLRMYDKAEKNRITLSLVDDGTPVLIITDAEENPRASLGLFNDNSPALALWDEKGNIRGIFSHKDDQPGLFLFDADGETRGQFNLEHDGQPWLRLSDAEGKTRGLFALTQDCPSLSLLDAKMELRGTFSLVDGSPGLHLYDTAGKGRGSFYLADGIPNLDLFDANEKMRGSFYLENDQPRISFFNAEENIRGWFGLGDDDPALVLFDQAGKPRGMFSVIGEPNLFLLDATGETIWSPL